MSRLELSTRTDAGIDSGSRADEFRDALTQQRRFRIDQIEELAADEASADAATRGEPRDLVTEAIKTAAETALAEIDAALDRLAGGQYGQCEACASAIPVERLEILPMVRFCMSCQRAKENRSR